MALEMAAMPKAKNYAAAPLARLLDAVGGEGPDPEGRGAVLLASSRPVAAGLIDARLCLG